MSEEEYIKFNESIKHKPFNRLKAESPEIANTIQNIVDDMLVHMRKYNRNYNEWLISRPEICGGFFWGKSFDAINSVEKNYGIGEVPVFIREYLAKNDLPLVFFGE